jgi:hypothetical protein
MRLLFESAIPNPYLTYNLTYRLAYLTCLSKLNSITQLDFPLNLYNFPSIFMHLVYIVTAAASVSAVSRQHRLTTSQSTCLNKRITKHY